MRYRVRKIIQEKIVNDRNKDKLKDIKVYKSIYLSLLYQLENKNDIQGLYFTFLTFEKNRNTLDIDFRPIDLIYFKK